MIEAIIGFLLGIGTYHAFNWLVQRTATSIYMREKGARGNEKRAENTERLSAAVVEAAALYKSGKTPVEIAKELLPKYPDVALQLGKKLAGKGFLDGIEGLI